MLTCENPTDLISIVLSQPNIFLYRSGETCSGEGEEEEEEEADCDDTGQDNRVLPLLEARLLNQVINDRKSI